MAKNTYVKAQEEATKAALEATDKANVAKNQAEEVLAKMQKYFQQLIIESVVAIKNSKRPLSPAPATITESPETKEKQPKNREVRQYLQSLYQPRLRYLNGLSR